MLYYIKPELIKNLEQNGIFRTELALELGVSERAVYNTVKRLLMKPISNSSFTKIAAIRFFESKGISEDQIITTEKPAV